MNPRFELTGAIPERKWSKRKAAMFVLCFCIGCWLGVVAGYVVLS